MTTMQQTRDDSNWDDDERNVLTFLRQHNKDEVSNDTFGIHKDIINDVGNLAWNEIEHVDYNFELMAAEYLNIYSEKRCINNDPNDPNDPYDIEFATQDFDDDEDSDESDGDVLVCDNDINPNNNNNITNTLNTSPSPLVNPELLDKLVKNPTMYS